jgi:general secretion pathway protein J
LRRGAGGFTLIELLIALSLMALLMGGAYEILTVARRTQNRAMETVRLNQVGRACLARIRRDLESLVQETSPFNTGLYAEDGETSRDGYAFPGDYVTFLTASNVARLSAFREDPDELESSVAADMIEIQYYIGADPDSGEVGLIRRVKWRLNSAQDQEEDAWESECLAEEVLGLNVRYFDGEAWEEEWDSESQEEYPKAVEVTLTLGRVFFGEGEWPAVFPDGSPTARKVFTLVVPFRAQPQNKQGAQPPEAGIVR